jgi:glutamyl-tRNA reductase
MKPSSGLRSGVPGLCARAHTLEGDQAARHAFRVARRNSMVLGEPPRDQMKDAVRKERGRAPWA